MKISKTHPRYKSLQTRERIVKGVEKGLTSIHGLIAQGRGEAFDYFIGEKSNRFAKIAIEASAALLLIAKNPVISINGNSAALASNELVELGRLIPAPLEVNIFHPSKKREQAIRNEFLKLGTRILVPSKKYKIKYLSHNRKYVNEKGILKADVVFVPLEDGDRCNALIKNGKKVISVDLNPRSRTAINSTITIVDNITRAIKLLNSQIKLFKNKDRTTLLKILKKYDNTIVLKQARTKIKNTF